MVISTKQHPLDLARRARKTRVSTAAAAAPSSTRLATLHTRRRSSSSDKSSTNSASWGLASEHESFKSLGNAESADDVLQMPFARAPLHRSFSFHGMTKLRDQHLAAGGPYLHESPDDSWERKSLKFVDLSTHQRKTITCLWATKVTYYFALGTLPVVLPASVESRGWGAIATGTLFTVWAVSALIFWPLWRLALQKFGTKNLLSVGVFLAAVAYVLYGFLHFEDFHHYMILAYVCRTLEGAGFAALEIACNAKILAEFPRNEDGAYSSVQSCIGIGVTLGCCCSGFLYSYSDIAGPFFLNATLLFLVGFLIIFLLERRPYLHADVIVSRKRRRKFLRTLSIYAAIFMLFNGILAVSSLFPLLQPHFQESFGTLNQTLQGIVMGVMPLCFVLGNAFWQWLITHDYVCGLDCTNIFGLLLMAVSLLLLGPAKAFQIAPNLLSLNVVCLIVIGTSMSMVYISSLNSLLEAAERRNINRLAAYSLISTTCVVCMLLGMAIGPVLGGALRQFYYDFPRTLGIMSAILMSAAIVDMFFALVQTCIRLRNYNRMAAELRYRSLHSGGATSKQASRFPGATLANKVDQQRNLTYRSIADKHLLSVKQPLLATASKRSYGTTL